MTLSALPNPETMYRALVERDSSYDGIFFTAVTTTGIFCRPTCPARKPAREHVEFYAFTREALFAGFRPCKRCRPLDPADAAPPWLDKLLAELERTPGERWTDADLRARGLDPGRVRRWFKARHGMSFHAYQRARRLGRALGQLRTGGDVITTAYDNGYDSLSGFYDAFKRLLGTTPGRGRQVAALHLARLATPLGPMLAAATDEALCLLDFNDQRMLETRLRRLGTYLDATPVPGPNAVLQRLEEELEQYFTGTLQVFSVPLLTFGTPFQRAVWDSLLAIPYGQTRSYAEQATSVGRPSAVRAVARTNADNRIAIVIPCHRVVGSDGQLTGYGGGLWRKRFLLELEQRHARVLARSGS